MKASDFFHVDEFKAMVGSRIFSAEFVKKNGELRKIVCRLGVTKALKGGELTYNPSEKNYLVVYDLQKKSYRTINFNTLTNIKFMGIEENFE